MNTRRSFVAATAAAVLLLTPAAGYARHGADDPAGHDRNDDRVTAARHGADDGARHDRRDDHGRHHRRHHGDDGPNHD